MDEPLVEKISKAQHDAQEMQDHFWAKQEKLRRAGHPPFPVSAVVWWHALEYIEFGEY